MVALALEREDPEEIFERVAHIRARVASCAGRHPVQAQQPHHVVDAQRARCAHVPPQSSDEGCIGGIAQPLRNLRRQSPILSRSVVGVGRRADAGAHGIERWVGPALRASRVDPDGEVLQQPHAKAKCG